MSAPTPDTREILARVAEIEGRVGKATPKPWRRIATDELRDDPEVVENGAALVATLGGLNRDGQRVWTVVGPLWPAAPMASAGDADLIAHAPTDLADLCRIVRGLVGGAS